MSDNNVKVAVRVRPFNDREKSRNATSIIKMEGNNTTIKDPKGKEKPRTFTFDHSYWSHDGFAENGDGYFAPEDPKYADQKRVFEDLGLGVLKNAWDGYNCSLFAYGQTGSGKSYSMVGPESNKGIVPICCEQLFSQMAEKQSEGVEYQVTISMLEIYCEKVRDLLSSKPPPKGGLRVRDHPKKGFYVENLLTVPVGDYASVDARIQEGSRNRTIAATNMNATSSRAHTIVQIIFTQKGSNDEGHKTHKRSIINLVDLAGSERQKDANTEGDRLKEGIVINQSLSTLGRCIKALADQQTSNKKQSVPYRDSVLTSLLKNALGGNSKTVMIAALSPADINYDETLSTLRYADRAKSIKTQAVVNESATDRLIRELKEENQRLQGMLANGESIEGGGTPANEEELETLRQQLEQNKREMAEMESNWQERLAANGSGVSVTNVGEMREKRKESPHFWNLNEDPALTDVIVHFLTQGETRVGCQESDGQGHINLSGLNILEQHAVIENENDEHITIKPLFGAGILVNGIPLKTKPLELHNNDRVHFGGSHLYVFAHPKEIKSSKGTQLCPTYDMAQSEIARHAGIMTDGPKSEDDIILEEELIRLLPMVSQANAMALELDKKVDFEIVLVAPEARGRTSGMTEIMVKLRNQVNDNEFLWEKDHFISRYYGMQEHYQDVLEMDSKGVNISKDADPFFEPSSTEVLIGVSHVYLKSLVYLVEIDEQLPITDYKGSDKGHLQMEIVPCKEDGQEIIGRYVENPKDLVGKALNCKIKIKSAAGLNRKYVESRCKFCFYGQNECSTTMAVAGSNPKYGFEKMYNFKSVEQKLVDHFEDNALIIEVFGKQSEKRVGKAIPSGPYSMSNEKAEQMAHKLERIDTLLQNAKNSKAKSIPVSDLRKAVADDDLDEQENDSADEAPKEDKKKKKTKDKDGSRRKGSARGRSKEKRV